MHNILSSFKSYFSVVISNVKTPGPAYAIDPTITRYGKDGTASYSVYGRPKDLEPFKTPGAAAYAPEKYAYPFSPRAPAYSLGLRTRFRKSKNNNLACSKHNIF